jgi:cell division transport system permease protein
VVIATAVLGVVLALFFWVQAAANDQRNKLDLVGYVSLNATPSQVSALGAALQQNPKIKAFHFKSREDALREQKVQRPEIFKLLPGNPLPASFTITPKDPAQIDQIVQELSPMSGWLKDQVTPDGFTTPRREAKDLLAAVRVIKWGGLALITILLLSAVLLIGNTIRLSIFARRREVEVMRLVGATNWFIRWPFVIEGLIFGLVGAVLAVILMVVVKSAIWDRIFNGTDSPITAQSNPALGFAAICALLVLAGAFIGALGSGVTLRRFLKV